MKKPYLTAALLIPVILAFNACGKNSPAAPDDSTATATSTNIIYIQPSITETSTITPTMTVSPTFTITQTETPFIIDDFNDNNLFNNIDKDNNLWYSYSNIPEGDSNTYTVSTFGIVLNGTLALTVAGTCHANVVAGSNYFTTYGMAAPVLFTPSTGINFNNYKKLIFSLVEYVSILPSAAGTYYFKVKLFDAVGNQVEHDISAFVADNWAYHNFALDISSFIVPAGVTTYAASDVLPNVVEIRWEYGIVSALNNDFSESTMTLDNIFLEK